MSTGTDTRNTDHVTGGEYVSLFDRIAVLADVLPASHVISESKVGRFISAVVHYVEHGADLLDCADSDVETARRELLLPVSERRAEATVPEALNAGYPEARPDSTVGDSRRDAELASLRDQLAAMNDRLAVAEASKPAPAEYVPPVVPDNVETDVTVEPSSGGQDPAAAPPARAAGSPASPNQPGKGKG